MASINDSFFQGHYKDLWKAIIPEELTRKEVDFMIPYFGLKNGSKVLDMMCGYGRHALALARQGVSVTAVDNLADYTKEIEENAKREGLPVEVIQGSVEDLAVKGEYDLVICMGNSLQFFNKTQIINILQKVSAVLKAGGHLLVNSWSLAETAFKNYKENSWSEIGDKKFLVRSTYHHSPSRFEVNSVIISPDGKTEEKDSVDFIYTINEMESMMNAAGLKLEEVYSIPGRKKFTLGEPRAYLVAVKQDHA
jgi:ubiquinone/menaquinone biosynthesis C-methylase UbiE